MDLQLDVRALISHIVRADGAAKCRLCLRETSENPFLLDHTVMVDGDKAISFAELLESVTGVKVINFGISTLI